MIDSVKFMAGLAHAAKAPTEFRFLNNGVPYLIGADANSKANFDRMLELIEDQGASGATPLCGHITSVVEQIRGIEAQLRSDGKKVAVIIQTDGVATDGDLKEVIKAFQALPVWLVVRLCTNEAEVVSYWSNIDRELELNMDILDDFESEGNEVFAKNPWLSYAYPLHQLREFGANIRELDLLDEETLTPEQVKIVCWTV